MTGAIIACSRQMNIVIASEILEALKVRVLKIEWWVLLVSLSLISDTYVAVLLLLFTL